MNNPILLVHDAGYGETPPAEGARFKQGDVVKVRKKRSLASFPHEAVVMVAVPPGFPAEYALADLLGERRPLMVTKPSRSVRYILANEGDRTPYLMKESDLLPEAISQVEIGTISREPYE